MDKNMKNVRASTLVLTIFPVSVDSIKKRGRERKGEIAIFCYFLINTIQRIPSTAFFD